MGGALREAKPGHGALAAIDAAYMGFAVGIPVDAEVDAAIEAQLDRMHERLAPWTASQMYLNFRERSKGSAEFFSPEAYRRLRAVKARYDAADVIRGNHQIRPSRVRRSTDEASGAAAAALKLHEQGGPRRPPCRLPCRG